MEQDAQTQLIQRFTLATFLEAVRLYDEQIASAEEIDIAMRAGAGLKQGPFHWADSRGLDLVLQELHTLAADLGGRFAPPASLVERVAKGQLGAKTGQGYLTWEGPGQ